MVKRLTFWRPRPEVSRDEALQYWTGDHAQLVERVPGVKRYVQNVCVIGPDGVEPSQAGLGELWFDSMEDAEAALTSAEWKAVIEDAAVFMDLEQVAVVWAEEHGIR